MIQVFEFNNFHDFVREVRTRYPGRRRPIPFRAWASKLGYRSSRSLEMVTRGTRLPSREMVQAICVDLGLRATEARYLELLVIRERVRRSGRDESELLRELSRLRSEAGCRTLGQLKTTRVSINSESFQRIRHWSCLVIRQLVEAGWIHADPELISGTLRGKITPAEAEASLLALTQLGLVRKNSMTGNLEPAERTPLATMDDVPSLAVREHHSQMLERAREALGEQSVGEREFLSLTFRFEKTRIFELKRRLRQFCEQIDREFSSERGGEVHQLGIQFFSHEIGKDRLR